MSGSNIKVALYISPEALPIIALFTYTSIHVAIHTRVCMCVDCYMQGCVRNCAHTTQGHICFKFSFLTLCVYITMLAVIHTCTQLCTQSCTNPPIHSCMGAWMEVYMNKDKDIMYSNSLNNTTLNNAVLDTTWFWQ